ncbi:MAG TPA: protein-glutamate O-methyltransferase CheR [Gammaproteobacteria bacterium]|nr:protein-glutamate O-methyltransferase CheR [Gammaproteobacteria bacterium]
MNERVISKQEYDDFRKFLANATGIILGDSKQYLVSSRLNRLMEENKLANYAQLLKQVVNTTSSPLRTQVIDAMTTNETMWFRDVYPYEILKTQLLPELNKIKNHPIRIWSAACSSGQEPYSISMIVQEFLASNPGSFAGGIQIVGTDISSSMLRYCQGARYDAAAMRRGISEERIQRFFTKVGNEWEVNRDIRARVSFKPLNLQQNYSILGKFDLIFCRNVLIYFSAEFKTDILTRMADVMHREGYLFLGSSETPTRYTPLYKMIRTPKGAIYRLDSA